MEKFGHPETIQRVTKAIATLDLIICPEWEYRYYSYNSRWSDDEEMASMRDGFGDEWFLLFQANGWCGLKGLAHESDAADDVEVSGKLRDVVPAELSSFRDEPAFKWVETSFCYWYEPSSGHWVDAAERAGLSPELDTGAQELLGILGGNPADYERFAKASFEVSIPRETIDAIYRFKPLTPDTVASINSECALGGIAEELDEIGYPWAQ